MNTKPCVCRIEYDKTDSLGSISDGRIIYCFMHAAAQELLAALQRVEKYVPREGGDYSLLANALYHAEGRT